MIGKTSAFISSFCSKSIDETMILIYTLIYAIHSGRSNHFRYALIIFYAFASSPPFQTVVWNYWSEIGMSGKYHVRLPSYACIQHSEFTHTNIQTFIYTLNTCIQCQQTVIGALIFTNMCILYVAHTLTLIHTHVRKILYSSFFNEKKKKKTSAVSNRTKDGREIIKTNKQTNEQYGRNINQWSHFQLKQFAENEW